MILSKHQWTNSNTHRPKCIAISILQASPCSVKHTSIAWIQLHSSTNLSLWFASSYLPIYKLNECPWTRQCLRRILFSKDCNFVPHILISRTVQGRIHAGHGICHWWMLDHDPIALDQT
jgi:hypothetical protein